MTHLYFIRHGETSYNKNNILMGSIDAELNKAGIAQARSIADFCTSLNIKVIYSSPLTRALQTAKIISKTIACPIVIVEELAERYYGDWEGVSKKEIPIDRSFPPNGEHVTEFESRVQLALKLPVHPGNQLIVSHSGVYRAIKKIRNLSALSDFIGNGEVVELS